MAQKLFLSLQKWTYLTSLSSFLSNPQSAPYYTSQPRNGKREFRGKVDSREIIGNTRRLKKAKCWIRGWQAGSKGSEAYRGLEIYIYIYIWRARSLQYKRLVKPLVLSPPTSPSWLIFCPKRGRCCAVINDYKVFGTDDYQTTPDPAFSLHNIRHFDVPDRLLFSAPLYRLLQPRDRRGGTRRVFRIGVCARTHRRRPVLLYTRRRTEGSLAIKKLASMEHGIAGVHCATLLCRYDVLIGDRALLHHAKWTIIIVIRTFSPTIKIYSTWLTLLLLLLV